MRQQPLQLESFLVGYLAREKFNALMDAVSRRALEFIEAVLMEAGIIFEQSLKQAASERRLIHDVLAGDKKRATAFVEEQSRDLQQAAGRFLKEIMNGGPGSRSYGQSSKAGIQMDQRLDGLVRRNVENIRWSMLQNLNISFAGFARRTQERLDETVAATKGAMQAAHDRRQAHDGSVEPEVTRMGDCLATLEELKTDFTILRSGEGGPPPSMGLQPA